MDPQTGRKRRLEEVEQDASEDAPIKSVSKAGKSGQEDFETATVETRNRDEADLLSALSTGSPGFRLEAIFLPKFENENRSDQTIRQSMMDLVASDQGYAEVTLKHSGSLLLWSGGQRFYSKNSTNNPFTFSGEILLRQHFFRVQQALKKKDGEDHIMSDDDVKPESGNTESLFHKCSDYVEQHRLTLSFEVVTTVLGDHGATPQRDYLILTAVADRSRLGQHFFSTLELLQLAQKFYLPHNDAWVFSSKESIQKLFQYYDQSRETGLASTAVEALSQAANANIQSMYPHEVCHSNILEGFVIRYVAFSETKEECLEALQKVAETSRRILRQIPTEFPSGSMTDNNDNVPTRVLMVDLRALHTKNGQSAKRFEEDLCSVLRESGPRSIVKNITSDALQSALTTYCNNLRNAPSPKQNMESNDIAKLIQTLSTFGMRIQYSVFSELEPTTNAADESQSRRRWLCMIHVYQDRTFQKYRKEQKKNPQEIAMDLFRGFCIEICSPITKQEPSQQKRTDATVSATTTQTTADNEIKRDAANELILKMKFIPYMVRTFGCRNGIRFLKQRNTQEFKDYASDLLTDKWQVSLPTIEKWLPYLHSWGDYVHANFSGSEWSLGTTLSSPRLQEENYLQHLMHFEQAYYHQQQQSSTTTGATPSKQQEPSGKKFKGLVVVLAVEDEIATKAAKSIASVWLNGTQLLEGGTDSISRESLLRYCTSIGGRVCWGTLAGEKAKTIRNLPESEKKNVALILVGCSDKEIESHFAAVSTDQRKFKGISKSWRKTRCGVAIELASSFLGSPENNEESIAEARRKLWDVSDSIGDVDERSGLLVFFPASVPGCGKSTLLAPDTVKKLEDTVAGIVKSQTGMKTRKLVVMSGDKQQKKVKFWPSVIQHRLQGTSAITLADKNVPKPTWDQVAQICASTNARGVPVIPDRHGVFETTWVEGSRTPERPDTTVDAKHHYPFTLAYLAVCLTRIMDRDDGSHPGKLDPSQKHACMVVVKFFAFFRGVESDDFVDRLNRTMAKAGALSRPVTVPFFDRRKSIELPQEMKGILLEALQAQFGWDSKRADVEKSSGNGYIEGLESRLRAAVAKNRDLLHSLCVEQTVSCQQFVSQVSARLVDVDEAALSFVKIVSIDVSRDAIDSVIQEILSSNDTAEGPNFNDGEKVRNVHVTMAHYTQLTQELINQNFQPLLGKDVEVFVTGMLWNERIAALSVRVAAKSLVGASMPEPLNSFPHITIWHGIGVPPSESNKLPTHFAAGLAQKKLLEREITLKGSLSFWGIDQS
ncbi:expressed unknown protein [Seminavis robusta]|uniref:tRNA ligase phosphodiesterase domain-containing protein n=1 Tax=Seminavis robusta TaxID=568900 RepID=A0A9N8ENB3_9STRA|nr:expressed unknown protein [Seminavis robusta]|eukprot:Sro1612_g285950.1 n/a (1283) ;mRNA; r:3080-7004